MKKKAIIFVSVVVSLIVSILIFLCCCSLESCFYSKLTFGRVKRNLSEWYKITLPESVTMEGYASDISPTDGQYYAVLKYDGSNEEFNSIFSYEKDKEIESYFDADFYLDRMHDFSKNFSIPDFENKYGWLYLLRRDVDSDYSSSTMPDKCVMMYFYDLNKLVVFIEDF